MENWANTGRKRQSNKHKALLLTQCRMKTAGGLTRLLSGYCTLCDYKMTVISTFIVLLNGQITQLQQSSLSWFTASTKLPNASLWIRPMCSDCLAACFEHVTSAANMLCSRGEQADIIKRKPKSCHHHADLMSHFQQRIRSWLQGELITSISALLSIL